jgi:hypothetical protein
LLVGWCAGPYFGAIFLSITTMMMNCSFPRNFCNVSFYPLLLVYIGSLLETYDPMKNAAALEMKLPIRGDW